jgi:hypothetical protein
MEIGDWITLAAVLVALGLGVASILHTRSMQKRERKERLIKEIIDWAIEVNSCSLGKYNPAAKDVLSLATSKASPTSLTKMIALELQTKFNVLNSTSIYLLSLRKKIFSKYNDLAISISLVKRSISQYIKFLELLKNGKVPRPDKSQQILLTKLYRDTENLINLAVDRYSEL